MSAGKVYLVGAGPGDPSLLTQKGAECLRKAGVVVYDRLLDESLLALVPPDAEKIYVGKASGEHTLPQEEINLLLVNKAKEGKTVVRLKGGDPFVLGRGGEEAETLAEHGIPFAIVPGITSAIAVPAYAGIPVTHRGLAASFAVVTGHEDPAKDGSSIDWAKLGVDTLVFLMGMKNLPEIVARLRENGRAAQTPVAVIKEGTHPQQQTVTGTLEDIVALVAESGLTAPAVVVVGRVVQMRERLRWFDNRPLSGKRVLVTRARSQASELSRLLKEHGAVPVELPVIAIRSASDTAPLDTAISRLEDYHWLIFTSVNGVAAFWERLQYLGRDSRALGGRQIGAIGPATAQALEARGILPDYVPETYTGEGVVAGLKERGIAGQRFLLPRADIADAEMAQGIRGLGGEVTDITAYRTVPAEEAVDAAKELIAGGGIDVITFTSSSTVTNLVAALGDGLAAVKTIRTACIGPKTAATAEKAGLRVDVIAQEQTIPGLVRAIEDYFRREA
ncbi:MAG: uroporphyrinogen-III C-methyltransferase [Chloroflexota bacterium]